jgi:RHS repeat-associated protein
LRKFVYGPGIDEPICMIDVADNNAVYYYHFDGLGSVIALSNENNKIIERYSYDVFGEPNRTSDVNNPYLFTGRRYDNASGLYYYRARYYAYDIGRFLQTDPIGYDDGLNLYTYCGNNPIRWSDPFGLCTESSSEQSSLLLATDEQLLTLLSTERFNVYHKFWLDPWHHSPKTHIVVAGQAMPKPERWPYPPPRESGAVQWLLEEALGLGIGAVTSSPISGTNPTTLGDATIIGNEYRRIMKEEQERIEGERAWHDFYTRGDPHRHERYPFHGYRRGR